MCDLRTLFRTYLCSIVCVTLGHCSGHTHVVQCVILRHCLENAHLVCTLSLLCAKSTPSVCKQNKQKTPHKKHERKTYFVSAQHRERRFLLLFVVVVILMCVRACVRACVCVGSGDLLLFSGGVGVVSFCVVVFCLFVCGEGGRLSPI